MSEVPGEMATTRDLYEILGVPRDATQEDIKKAYRSLARRHHPDVSDSPEAEQRFKEVTGAYEILSDPAKRRQYDMFGSGGGPEAFPFGDVGDIFEMFFGGGGGFGTRRRTRPRHTREARGDDVFATLTLEFAEAVFGAEREAQIEVLTVCERCTGQGSEPGSFPSPCRRCGGSGEVQDMRRSIFGTVMTATPCVACEGTGEEITQPCSECRGAGRVPGSRTVKIEVPQGVSDGVDLRISGAGHAGRAGGGPGDLFVSLRVREHDVFARRGQDLYAELPVPMVQAALGAELEVETLDGPERIRLDAGTQSGTVARLRGRGVPNLGRRGRGDLFLAVRVETPTHLGKDERSLLQQLADQRGEAPAKGSRATLRRPEA